MSVLKTTISPAEIKTLKEPELKDLAGKIRQYLIEVSQKNGGHLSSNLGVVELTLALHYVFDTPSDKIIWDVGHQCYIHKLLTGRDISSIRTDNLSGFPKREESAHDAFGTGHSSTSLSAAAGIAAARKLADDDFNIVSVIGDAALSGGMAFEALNHIGEQQHKMLIVLNDNKMSISKNVGALSKYLSKFRLNKNYNNFKKALKKTLNSIPLIGKGLVKSVQQVKRFFKFGVVHGRLFEALGIKYIGPIDGHNVVDLIRTMNRCKTIQQPVLLHIRTQKGKGYNEAEKSPDIYHGLASYDEKNNSNAEICLSQVAGKALCELAAVDNKITAITAAMPQGTGLEQFSKEYPHRFFDVGIAEQHAVTFCAGLASQGFKPYFAVYSTFLQRGFDQVLHDVCLQKLGVRFLIDRAGIVGADGATHQGIFDISYLRLIPNITILAPKDAVELKNMILWSQNFDAPLAIRYPKSTTNVFETHSEICLGKWEKLTNNNSKNVLLCCGDRMIAQGLELCKLLDNDADVVNCRFIKPLDFDFLDKSVDSRIVIMEENVSSGGFGSAVCEYYISKDKKPNIKIFALPDKFLGCGKPFEIYSKEGVDIQSILAYINKK